MTVDENKDLVRRLYAEVVSAGDIARVEEFVSEDYLDHNAEGAGRGPGVLRAHVEAVRRTFPGFRLRIEDVVAEGDRVATRVTAQGTHRGRWMSIEPTGVLVRLKGSNIDRVVGGKRSSSTGGKRTRSACCGRWGATRSRDPRRRSRRFAPARRGEGEGAPSDGRHLRRRADRSRPPTARPGGPAPSPAALVTRLRWNPHGRRPPVLLVAATRA